MFQFHGGLLLWIIRCLGSTVRCLPFFWVNFFGGIPARVLNKECLVPTQGYFLKISKYI